MGCWNSWRRNISPRIGRHGKYGYPPATTDSEAIVVRFWIGPNANNVEHDAAGFLAHLRNEPTLF